MNGHRGRQPRRVRDTPGADRGALQPRGRTRGWVVLGWLAIAVVAAGPVWNAVRPRALRAPAGEAASPATEMTPERAFSTAVALGEQGRAHESLPFFRRAADSPSAGWIVHHDYSSALHDASVASRARAAGLESANRTSLVRIALLHASLIELDIAAQRTGAPSDRSLVHLARGRSLAAWGLPLDALEEYRLAARLDPAAGEPTERVEKTLALLARPAEPGEHAR